MSDLLFRMLEARPEIVQFETIARCNAACTLCCYPRMRRPRGQMDWSLVEAITSQAEGARTLIPFLIGEPLLDTRIRDVLRLCREAQPGVSTVLYSNMSLCDEETSRWLVSDQTLDLLCVSFYGPDPWVHRELQPPLDFFAVRRNIIRLLRERHDAGARLPRVRMQYVLTDRTRPGLQGFVHYWSALADGVEIVPHDTWRGQQPERDSTKPAWPGPIPCHRLWSALNIHHDGAAVACCLDYEAEAVVGRLPEQALLDIWRGEPLAELRRLHLERRHAEIPICRQCTSWSQGPRWWTAFWLETLYGVGEPQAAPGRARLGPGPERRDLGSSGKAEAGLPPDVEVDLPCPVPG